MNFPTLEPPALESFYERLWDDYSRWWDSEAGLSRKYKYLGDEWGDESWVNTVVENYGVPYLSKDSHVLEIGPGGGRYTAALAPHCARLICVDVSSEMLARLRQRFLGRNHFIFLKGNGHDLADVPDDHVDFVWSFNVFVQLEFEDVVSYLEEIRRVLKPGGKAALHYAAISNQAGWEYFLGQCRAWMSHPKPRSRFSELTLETMALLAERLSFRLVTNQHLARDAMVILEKPRLEPEGSAACSLPAPGPSAVPCPILFPKGTGFFFLVGSMRSGTTWLMDLLNTHPEMCCNGEMHPVEMLDLSLPTLESVARNSVALKQWHTMPNNAWCNPFRDGSPILDDLEGDFVRFFFEWTLFRFVRSQGDRMPRFIGDKSPSHTRRVARRIRRFFGRYEPFVLHIVRDPRDAAVSRWFQLRSRQRQQQFLFAEPFRSEEDKAACESLLADPEGYARRGSFFSYPEFLSDVFEEWLDVNVSLRHDGPDAFGERYRMVKYEELKSDLRGSLQRIFRWFGANGSPSVVAEIIERNDVTKMPQKRDTFRKGTTGEWEKYFSPADIELFRDRVLPRSKDFGYA